MALELPQSKEPASLTNKTVVLDEVHWTWLDREAASRQYSRSEFLREILNRVMVATEGQAA
jgi:hypothetical protein